MNFWTVSPGSLFEKDAHRNIVDLDQRLQNIETVLGLVGLVLIGLLGWLLWK